MKATGIVRRIDELGRVVIAKEVRDTLTITTGTAIEMTLGKNGLVLQKHQVGGGIVRNIDLLGRIVIAKEIRRRLNWETGTPIELFVDGHTMILREYAPGCVICGDAQDGMQQFNGKNICPSCVSTIKSAG